MNHHCKRLKHVFFDSLACAFLALEHDKVHNFCSLAYIKDSSGSVGVIGTDTKTNVVDATFLNATNTYLNAAECSQVLRLSLVLIHHGTSE